jgi:hypothetical protein
MKTTFLKALLLTVFISSNGHATTVIIDFNDLNTGGLDGQSTTAPGTTGDWTVSADINQVVSGNLVAPASTNFGIAESGTAQRLQGPVPNDAENGTVSVTPLTGNTIWGSFLLNLNGDPDARSGIQFNSGPTDSPNDPRILALGTTAQARLGGTNVSAAGAFSDADFDDTYLFLFKIDVDDAGSDTINFWINPDVTSEATIGSATASGSRDFLGATGITSVSFFVYDGAPFIDSFRLSDDADAFLQVTAIPEPSTLLLVSGAMVALALFRRRR